MKKKSIKIKTESDILGFFTQPNGSIILFKGDEYLKNLLFILECIGIKWGGKGDMKSFSFDKKNKACNLLCINYNTVTPIKGIGEDNGSFTYYMGEDIVNFIKRYQTMNGDESYFNLEDDGNEEEQEFELIEEELEGDTTNDIDIFEAYLKIIDLINNNDDSPQTILDDKECCLLLENKKSNDVANDIFG